MAAEAKQEVIWEPMPGPQEALIACPVFEVFYGGARGGGKSEGMIGDWLDHSARYGERATGIFFRRTFVQLGEVMARCAQLFPKIGAKWNGERAEWTMPGGARLMFRHLDRDSDAENYQGFNLTRVYFEEVTNFPSPSPIDKLRATLRSATGVQVGLRLTGNPGGPGHAWVKKRYIDPCPAGYASIKEQFNNPFTQETLELERIFIPSRLVDNTKIAEHNPNYVAVLQQAGSKQLVRAWLLGDWSIIDGAFFAEFDSLVHVLPTSFLDRIPPHTFIFRAFDWGYAKPFSVGWYAVSDGTWGVQRDALVKIDEWYGSTGQPNVGLRMDIDLVAEGIYERDMALKKNYDLKVKLGYADPSIFSRDGGPSIAERMNSKKVVWIRADNKREPGWQQIRRRLSIRHGACHLYFLEHCQDTIRTLPLLQHDEKKAEDLDTDGEDHAADETRYACMARTHIVDKEVETVLTFPKLPGQLTFDDVLKRNRKTRLARENA